MAIKGIPIRNRRHRISSAATVAGVIGIPDVGTYADFNLKRFGEEVARGFETFVQKNPERRSHLLHRVTFGEFGSREVRG